MSPFLRKVKTASGAVAVQIVEKKHGQRRILEHLGSAHTEAELAALLQIGHDKLQVNQPMLGVIRKLGLPCFCGHLSERGEGSAEGRVCPGRAEETPEEVHPRGYRVWGGPVGDVGLVVRLLEVARELGCGEQLLGKWVRTRA